MEHLRVPILVYAERREKPPLLMAALMVFVSTDTLFFGTNISVLARWVPYFFYCGVAIAVGSRAIVKRALTTRAFSFYALTVVLQILTLVVKDDNFNMSCFRLALLTAAFAVAMNYSFYSFAHAFEKVVFFLCAYSLIVYALCYIAPALISKFPAVTNVSGYRYHVVGPCIVPARRLGGFFRNTGIFREPGVYQMYINMALCFHLFCNEHRSIKKVSLYVIAMLTTISTAGIVCLAICLAVYFAGRSSGKSERQFKLLVALSLALCALFVALLFPQVVDSAANMMFDKLDKESSAHGSAVARMSSITSNIAMWKTSPLFGVGLNNSDRLFDYFTRLHYDYYYSVNVTGTHNTNTYLYQLSTYGLFFWAIFTWGLIGLSRLIAARTRGFIMPALIFVLFLFIYLNENLYYSLLPPVLMFFGLKERIPARAGQGGRVVIGV